MGKYVSIAVAMTQVRLGVDHSHCLVDIRKSNLTGTDDRCELSAPLPSEKGDRHVALEVEALGLGFKHDDVSNRSNDDF